MVHRFLIVFWVLFISCTRAGFDPTSGGFADTPLDSGGPAACGPFGKPARLAEVSTAAGDWSPSISGDGLTIYLSAPDGAQADILRATRPDPGSPFGKPEKVAELNDPAADDRVPSISSDGLEIYFGRKGVMRAARSRVDAPFSPPEVLQIGGVNAFAAKDGWLSADGLRLYLSIHRAGHHDLALARRSSRATAFQLVRLFDELNTTSHDGWATASPDEREILFESDRSGKKQIYIARRAARDRPFEAPEPITILGTGAADPDLSRDGQTIYFAAPGSEKHDIWYATRDCP